jgi:hypothetical protein
MRCIGLHIRALHCKHLRKEWGAFARLNDDEVNGGDERNEEEKCEEESEYTWRLRESKRHKSRLLNVGYLNSEYLNLPQVRPVESRGKILESAGIGSQIAMFQIQISTYISRPR